MLGTEGGNWELGKLNSLLHKLLLWLNSFSLPLSELLCLSCSWDEWWDLILGSFFPVAGVIWPCTRAAGPLTSYTKRLRQYSRKCFFLAGWGRAVHRRILKRSGMLPAGWNMDQEQQTKRQRGKGKSTELGACRLGPRPSHPGKSLPMVDTVMCSPDSPFRTEGLISPASGSNPRRAS